MRKLSNNSIDAYFRMLWGDSIVHERDMESAAWQMCTVICNHLGGRHLTHDCNYIYKRCIHRMKVIFMDRLLRPKVLPRMVTHKGTTQGVAFQSYYGMAIKHPNAVVGVVCP